MTVSIPDVLAAELLRSLAAGATALHDRDGSLPSPEVVGLWRDLLAARDRARNGTPASESAPPAPSMLDGQGMLTCRQAADRMGCDPSWIRSLARTGRIEAVRSGRDWLIDPQALDRYRFGSHP